MKNLHLGQRSLTEFQTELTSLEWNPNNGHKLTSVRNKRYIFLWALKHKYYEPYEITLKGKISTSLFGLCLPHFTNGI